jgi:hypothetical protein
MMEVFLEMKNALVKTNDLLRDAASANRKPADISQNEWSTLKRLASSLPEIKREDFALMSELCKILKIFHVETCRVLT